MRYAFDAVRRRPARTALTALGIGLAAGLVVLLLALSAGVETSSTTLAYSSGVDLIGLSPGSNLTSGEFPPLAGAHPLATEIPAADANVVVASPWLIQDLSYGNRTLWADANASAVPSGWTTTSSGTVGWIPSDNSGIEVPPVYQGTGFTAPGDPHYAGGNYTGPKTGEIEIDQGLAAVLRVGVGDPLWASPVVPPSPAALPGWYANATEFTVVGVTGPFWLVPSALLAYTYLSELQTLTGSGSRSTDYATLVLIHVTDPTDLGNDVARLADRFSGLEFFTLGNILGEIQHVVDLYRTFGTLIGAIGLVVAALFTTTVLQMSVDDRSRELALLRALGHSRASIGRFVVEEALVLTAFGLAVGLPIAYGTALALNRFLLALVGGLPTSFSFVSFAPTVILTGVGAVVAVGLVAALAPALRAMHLPVAEELRAP
ncbi:MAG TPA: FtsX-like permease family protein [Thermoplasmata archaeon]|nr:FtsX-like permease family protein [Thermoplasmata archaeon]